MAVPDSALLDELANVVGPAHVLQGDATTAFRVDGRGATDPNEIVVVRPASTGEVAATVTRCAAAGVAIVAMGGNTGMSFGTRTPDRPAIVVSLSRLSQVHAVDIGRASVTVGAGATLQAAQEAAAAAGLQFAPDWGARGTATIGGAIATDAGGHNVVRHGNLRDHVLGLEVVLADGRVWDGRRALRKDSSGYDLKHLFIGAEGTLGVVTSAVLRLVPATPHRTSALAALRALGDLDAFLSLARARAGAELTALELVPGTGVEQAAAVHGAVSPLATAADHAVLISLAGQEPVADRLVALLGAADTAGLITDAAVADTPAQEAALWELRDLLPPSQIFGDLMEEAVKLDVAVPVDRMADLIERVRQLAREVAPSGRPYAFGHVGDGNVHLYVLPPGPADDRFARDRPALEAAIDELVWEMGGTLSAEHGIGALLVDRIAPQKPAIEWELMRGIKRLLDPHDLFNPGKVLPPD